MERQCPADTFHISGCASSFNAPNCAYFYLDLVCGVCVLDVPTIGLQQAQTISIPKALVRMRIRVCLPNLLHRTSLRCLGIMDLATLHRPAEPVKWGRMGVPVCFAASATHVCDFADEAQLQLRLLTSCTSRHYNNHEEPPQLLSRTALCHSSFLSTHVP